MFLRLLNSNIFKKKIMAHEHVDLDFQAFVLRLPKLAWSMNKEALEEGASMAKDALHLELSPWQAASLYARLTGQKPLATVKDTRA